MIEIYLPVLDSFNKSIFKYISKYEILMYRELNWEFLMFHLREREKATIRFDIILEI